METYWNVEKKNSYEKINKNLETEVCIIGGGLTGLTTAYYLSKLNKKVVLLEKDEICNKTSGGSTGKITSQHGIFYKYLYETNGMEYVQKYYEINEKAINEIEEIINEKNINCEFERVDSYVYTCSKDKILDLKNEFDIVKKFGAEFVNYIELPIDIEGAIKFSNQAQFNPYKYAKGLAKEIIKNGGSLFENSKVWNINKQDKKYIVSTSKYKIKTNCVVIATRYPITKIKAGIPFKMYQSTSYCIVADNDSEICKGYYINIEKPTISIRRIKSEEKNLIQIVGYDYKTGTKQNINGYAALEKIVKNMYPKLNIKNKWIAEDCISLDKIPYIGKIDSNMYIATGFNKWGNTFSNIAANIIKDSILGRENEYSKMFDCSRFGPLKNKEELKNMIVEAGKSIVISKFKMPHKYIDELEYNQGKIIEYDDKKIGVYKNEDGKLFMVNPICSHLGCELEFNNFEKTWDCPCHGSRFTYEGKSIESPSIKDL